jgi:hypothetical protein
LTAPFGMAEPGVMRVPSPVALTLSIAATVSTVGCTADSDEPAPPEAQVPASVAEETPLNDEATRDPNARTRAEVTAGDVTPQAKCPPYACGENHNRRFLREG